MKKTFNNTITDLSSPLKLKKTRKRTKNKVQKISNSKTNIFKWGYFWISGQDKIQFWIETSSKKISLESFRFYNIIDGCINNR